MQSIYRFNIYEITIHKISKVDITGSEDKSVKIQKIGTTQLTMI